MSTITAPVHPFAVEMEYDTDTKLIKWTNIDGHPFQKYLEDEKESRFGIGPFTLDGTARKDISYDGPLNGQLVLTLSGKGKVSNTIAIDIAKDINAWNEGVETSGSEQQALVHDFETKMARRNEKRQSKRFKGLTVTGMYDFE